MIWTSLTSLGMAIIATIIIISVYQLYSGSMQRVLTYGTWALRLRYCLLLCTAPGLLGIIAWTNPNMLQALLLVRAEYAFWDIFEITMISSFTVGVGLALCRLVELHGGKRFANVTALLSMETAEPESFTAAMVDQHVSRGWSWIRIGWWWTLGLVLPGFILLTAYYEGPAKMSVLLLGTFLGWAAANLVAVFVAGLERWLLGHIDQTAEAGILPFEGCVNWVSPWKIGSWNVPWFPQIAKRVFGDPKHGLSWLLRGPGYTDAKTGVLLSGQPQALILVAFSATVYLSWYYMNLSDQTWAHLGWPSGFFAVLILFLIGLFMTGVGYWLDRYGLPPVVFAVLYVVTVFYFNVTDHYFDVVVVPASKSHKAADRPVTGNAYVAAATTAPAPGDTYEQLYWADVLKEWPFPEVNGQKTLVVVTASGGGIQAAAWTAKVLTELDQKIPGLSQSIGMVSAVSGGSVGTMFYLGHRGLIEPSGADLTSMLPLQPARDAIMDPSQQSSLEAVSWGVAFPDFVRTVVPLAAPRLEDRGWALESWWWNTMGRGLPDRELMHAVTIRDLIPLIAQHRLPPVVFNATCVETGQRVLISPMHINVDRSEAVEDTGLVSTPIDFLDYYDAALDSKTGSNVRISTAVRLSATFSYVTPVARPSIPAGMLVETKLQRRLYHHFCDGGYADNPGLVTAVRSLHDLLEYYRRTKIPPPFQQVLVIRIEPFPKTAAQLAKDNAGFESAVLGPSAALSATRVSSQAERSELALRLLEDANFRERHRLHSWTKGLAELRKLHQELPDQHTAIAEIRKIYHRAMPWTDPDNKAEVQLKHVLIPDPIALAELLGTLKQVDVPDNLKGQMTTVQDHLNNVMTLKSAAYLDRNIVPVNSVTFRFEVYPKDRQDTATEDEPIEPPLTWTLTESQKNDLNIAWDRILNKKWKELNPDTADTISPEGIRELFFTPVADGKKK